MAKKGGTRKGPLQVNNRVVEDFLIQLAVDDTFRTRFSSASATARRDILAKEFRVGNGSIDALMSGEPGRVTARLRVSDQQGTPNQQSTPKPKK